MFGRVTLPILHLWVNSQSRSSTWVDSENIETWNYPYHRANNACYVLTLLYFWKGVRAREENAYPEVGKCDEEQEKQNDRLKDGTDKSHVNRT